MRKVMENELSYIDDLTSEKLQNALSKPPTSWDEFSRNRLKPVKRIRRIRQITLYTAIAGLAVLLFYLGLMQSPEQNTNLLQVDTGQENIRVKGQSAKHEQSKMSGKGNPELSATSDTAGEPVVVRKKVYIIREVKETDTLTVRDTLRIE